jgi:hypothetical protein
MLYYHMGHDYQDVLLAKGWKDSREQDDHSRHYRQSVDALTWRGNFAPNYLS